MPLPFGWEQLPGPSMFLGTIASDLQSSYCVGIGVRDESVGAEVCIELSEWISQHRIGSWSIVRAHDEDIERPVSALASRTHANELGKTVVWVDACHSVDAAATWAKYIRDYRGEMGGFVICLAMTLKVATEIEEDASFRIRSWDDFVTCLDSRVLSEVRSREEGFGASYVALKGALAAELAGRDLSFAERVVEARLADILSCKLCSCGHQCKERVWAAQVAVLLPIVERERQRLLSEYFEIWTVPHIRKDGSEIGSVMELEIGDLAVQARWISGVRRELPGIYWLHRVRNLLAHSQAVPWELLVAAGSRRIVSFRD